MLDPFYLQPSPIADNTEVLIETYKVIAYSQVNQFVLIYWKIESSSPIFSRKTSQPEYIPLEGQTLWKGKTHIFTRAGKTSLLKPKTTRLLPGTAPKIHKNWLEEAAKEGQPYYGIPEAIAIQLQSPASLRYL
jgi:hypothetical protein